MNYTSYNQLLKEYIRFKSVSTDEKYKADVNDTADWLYNLLKNKGFEAEKISGYGNDIVLAKYIASTEYKTVLVYGHYDVQPAEKSEGWKNEPFDLYEEEGKLYARGVVDNKGQNLIHIASVLDLIEKNSLGFNVIFMLEGNEETGSPLLDKFVQDYAEKLRCDFVFFSDGELTMEHPVIETGFRGVMNVILKVKTSEKDNHSGLYGGSIPNAANILSKLLAGMHDDTGLLQLPGLENTLAGIDESLVKDIQKIPFEENTFLQNCGAKVRYNNQENFYLQNGYLTSAEVTTLNSGYLGEGFRNAIPGKAFAKINFRISPKHNSKQVIDAFTDYISQNIPQYAEFEIVSEEASEPISLDIKNEFARKAKELATDIYGKECYFKLCGAIVPVAGTFKDILHVPVISLGLGNEDCNMHGVNENYDIELIQKGLNLSNKFFTK